MAGIKQKSFANLTWSRYNEYAKAGRVLKVLLPMGSLEQHGPHLPLSTDTIIANHIATAVSEKCVDCLLMPPIELGCSLEHIDFPGTVSLQPETLTTMIVDIATSLSKSKLNSAFIINGHGGNKAAIDSTLIKIKHEFPEMQIYAFTILDLVKEKYATIRKSNRRLVGHADEVETSMMLAIRPELVEMEKAVAEEPLLPKAVSFEQDDLAKISFGWRAIDVTKSGVVGDARPANRQDGKVLVEYAVETIARIISEL